MFGLHEFVDVHVSTSICSIILWFSSCFSAAESIARICFVSSGVSIWTSTSLIWFSMVYGNSVLLAILIMMRLLYAVALAVSSICGIDCTAPVTSFVLVVISMAETVVLCCGGIVLFPSVRVGSGFGSPFSFLMSLLLIF